MYIIKMLFLSFFFNSTVFASEPLSKTLFIAEIPYKGSPSVNYNPNEFHVSTSAYFAVSPDSEISRVNITVNYYGNDSTRTFFDHYSVALNGLSFDKSKKIFRFDDENLSVACTTPHFYGDVPTKNCSFLIKVIDQKIQNKNGTISTQKIAQLFLKVTEQD